MDVWAGQRADGTAETRPPRQRMDGWVDGWMDGCPSLIHPHPQQQFQMEKLRTSERNPDFYCLE